MRRSDGWIDELSTTGRDGRGGRRREDANDRLTTARAATQTAQFYYCVANADFMLNDENNEHFPEILRERRRFFRKIKPQDFWIVANLDVGRDARD